MSGILDPVTELFSLLEQIIKALFDLEQRVRSGTAHIFIAQFDDHLGETSDGSHGMNWIVLT
jgi:hypothetical protein